MNILIIIGILIIIILFWILKETIRNGEDSYNQRVNDRNALWDKEKAGRLKRDFGGDEEAMRDYDQVQWEKKNMKNRS